MKVRSRAVKFAMKFQLFAFLVFLIIPSFHTQWIFPVPESWIDTPCTRNDGGVGIYKLVRDCSGDKSHHVGLVKLRQSILVCCPQTTSTTTTATTKATIVSRVGVEARNYCTSDRSSAKDDLGFKVIGGNFSDVGEFPHMAALGYKNLDGVVKFDCGGALISEKFVLTAAHCLLRNNPTFVRLGKVREMNSMLHS